MWEWYKKKSEEGTKNMIRIWKIWQMYTKKKRILTFLYHYHIFLIIFAFFVHSSFIFCIFPTFFVLYSYFLYHSHILCTLIFSTIILTWVFSSISTLRISISSKSAIIKIIWSLMEVPFVILMFMMVFRATYLVGLSLSPNIYYKLKRIL